MNNGRAVVTDFLTLSSWDTDLLAFIHNLLPYERQI